MTKVNKEAETSLSTFVDDDIPLGEKILAADEALPHVKKYLEDTHFNGQIPYMNSIDWDLKAEKNGLVLKLTRSETQKDRSIRKYTQTFITPTRDTKINTIITLQAEAIGKFLEQ